MQTIIYNRLAYSRLFFLFLGWLTIVVENFLLYPPKDKNQYKILDNYPKMLCQYLQKEKVPFVKLYEIIPHGGFCLYFYLVLSYNQGIKIFWRVS